MDSSNNHHKEYGLRWREFNKKGEQQFKERWFKSNNARSNFLNRIEERDGFWQVVAFCDPTH
jgi:hypothetical protein